MAMSLAGSWHFPPRSGGIDFVQDPSSAHFRDDPIPKLVREVIQNSLDARQSGFDDRPIIVRFTDTAVDRALIGASDLYKHLTACRDRAIDESLPSVQQVYGNALRTLRAKRVRCLRITDSNTTGLSGNKWNALVEREGAVEKAAQGAPGGSYGIGKNAVFNVSDIQTVFYSTKYVDERRDGLVEKLQGKATLMAHPNPKNPVEHLQHIGFYQSQERNPILGKNIPEFFGLEETGTGVFVMGFNPRSDDWIRDVQAAVVANYFYAIHHKKLCVEISAPEDKRIDITHETIDHLFGSSMNGSSSEAFHYYVAIRDEPHESTVDLSGAGALHVYVRTGKGPRRTAYVNRNGMLITASREQNVNPIAPRGKSLWPDYAAVVIPATDEGDRWIRTMENPSHDSISPGHLHDRHEKHQANRTFLSARRSIKEIIDRKAEIEQYGDTSNLDELADAFPDFDPTLEGNRKLPVRLIEHRQEGRIEDNQSRADARENDEADEGGRTYGDGTIVTDELHDTHGDGNDRGLPGREREAAPRREVHLRERRVIVVGDHEAIIAFTPSQDELEGATFTLTPAGEERDHESPIQIETAFAIDGDREVDIALVHGRVSTVLQADKRVLFRVTTRERIRDMALKLE